MLFIKGTWNVHCSFLPFLKSLATCLFDGIWEKSVSFRCPRGNKESVFKKETVPHAICNLSRGILNKRCEVLDSLVNTRPQAALLCSPLCFPKGELISTDQDNALFWELQEWPQQIWFRLYHNNTTLVGVKVLGDLKCTYTCMRIQHCPLSPFLSLFAVV